MENNCVDHLKSINNCRSYGPDKIGRMQALTHAHTPNCDCDNYVSLTTSRLDKKLYSKGHLRSTVCSKGLKTHFTSLGAYVVNVEQVKGAQNTSV